MLRKLKKIEMKLYWIDDKGDKHEGCPSWLRGDVSGLRGDVSGIYGNVSGIYGNVSGLRGDVDDCSITDKERQNGIDVKDLVG